MTDTIAGAVDIGMISRSIKDEETAQGIFWVSVTKDAVFPIISAENPVAEQILAKGISQEIFNKIYITGEIKTWGEVVGDPTITDEIHVFTRSDASGAAEQWAKFAGGKVQDDLKGIGVNGEPAMLDTVIKDPLGIGYGNLNSIFDLIQWERLCPALSSRPLILITMARRMLLKFTKSRRMRSAQLQTAHIHRLPLVSRTLPPWANPKDWNWLSSNGS